MIDKMSRIYGNIIRGVYVQFENKLYAGYSTSDEMANQMDWKDEGDFRIVSVSELTYVRKEGIVGPTGKKSQYTCIAKTEAGHIMYAYENVEDNNTGEQYSRFIVPATDDQRDFLMDEIIY